MIRCLFTVLFIFALLSCGVIAGVALDASIELGRGDPADSLSSSSGDIRSGGNKSNVKPCLTEDDLDFDSCDLDDLPMEELRAICERIGLDFEHHLSPYLFREEEETEDDHLPVDEWTYSHYVDAAYECLLIEEQTYLMYDDNPDSLRSIEHRLLTSDRSFIASLVTEVLTNQPHLVPELEEELQREEPELHQQLITDLHGDSLADRPELLGELLSIVLVEDPEILGPLGLLGLGDERKEL
mmetsp:Transcript_16754/g.25639  ORF Transcript_16754/g.25639 Transcript_16754/m.25639 type:complete len:241 (+) Transcript_16754:83-805(+)